MGIFNGSGTSGRRSPADGGLREFLEMMAGEILSYVESVEAERDKALKELARWNLAREIRRIRKELDACRRMAGKGFCPDEGQWERIAEWEKSHVAEHHASSPGKETKPLRKYDPGAARFVFSFSHTQVGVLGSVACAVCMERAIREADGEKTAFEELAEKADARFFFGEV